MLGHVKPEVSRPRKVEIGLARLAQPINVTPVLLQPNEL